MNKWKLPDNPPIRREGKGWFESSRNVIVTDIDNKVYMAFYVFQNKAFYWWSTSNPPLKIKAWMELPEPYKE